MIVPSRSQRGGAPPQSTEPGTPTVCRCGLRHFLLLPGLILLLSSLAKPSAAAAAGAGQAPSTNTLINCTNGATWRPTNAVFRGGVRVFDPQLYLECDHLTVNFPSNNASGSLKSGATPTFGSISTIVAETNLLMMLRGATIIGDRAVYSATNDIIHVTGEIVVIETESGYAYGTNFIFNRRSMELQSVGPSTLESKPGVSLIETNGLPGTPARPRRTPANNPGAAP